MKANQNRRVWLWTLAISGLALPVQAQNVASENVSSEMAARTREWRLDGTIVGLDMKRGVLRLQPDVLVMRAEGDAVAMGAARENATRLIATDDKTQMWTPDGQLRPLQFAALRNTTQIIAIGPLQNQNGNEILQARLLLLREGLPADFRPPQVLATPQTPPQISPPDNEPQVLAAPNGALQALPQVLAAPAAPHLSPPTRPQVLAPPLVNRTPQNADARRAAPETISAAPHSYAPDETKRATLSSEDWSRRVAPPTLSLAPGAVPQTNAPQVLAAPILSARAPATENRALTPPALERFEPQTPRLSATTSAEAAALANFAHANTENAPAAPDLRALAPTSAPRDGRHPTLSLDETPLRGRGALASVARPDIGAPDVGAGRASLRLGDAQTMLEQQRTAILARDNYAQLRCVQNSIAWPTFSNGAPEEKLVALTFDDGPHPTGTPAILEQLRRFGVPATFFVVGRNVEKHPELLQREAAEGHDIGSHSWHHFQGVALSDEQWHEEITGNNRIIENVLGVAPRWFRAPGCHYSRVALDALHDLQMVRVDSSNNSGDWEGGAPDKTVARVLNRLAPGQVLLFHDSVPQTAQALPTLLRELKARGYRCVTLSELAQRAAQVPGFVPDFHPAGQGIVLPSNVAATR